MTIDTLRAVATYLIAILVLIGGWYSLVIYEFALVDMKPMIAPFTSSSAISFVFSQEVAKTTANATTKALNTPVPPPPAEPVP